MKASRFTFLISLVLLILVSSSDVDVDENISDTNSLRFLSSYTDPNEKIGDMTFNLFGMMWSAKYYYPFENNYFSFGIPTAFNAILKVDPRNNIIIVDFTGTQNSIEQFNKVKVEAMIAQRLSFSRNIMKFYEDYTRVELCLSFMKVVDYELSSVNIYNNSIYTSVRIKITEPKSKVKRDLFVEFDFSKNEVTESEVNVFVKYLNSLMTVKK